MTTFIGDFPCKIDAKGRITLPSVFKKQLSQDAKDCFVVRKDLYEKCLVLYPMDEWERQVKIIRSKLNLYNKEHSTFLRMFYNGTAEIALDSSNRMLFPKRLLDEATIEKDVVLAGQDGRIQVWNKELYDKMGINEDDFATLAQKLLGGANFEENV